MRAIIIALLSGSLLLSGCSPGAYYGAGVSISNAPPPPHMHFRSRPHYSIVHGVYVLDDDHYDLPCDVFAYGGSWYAYDSGYWYRARSYNGPYVAVDVHRVPDRILKVPAKHWKRHPHGGPPGQRRSR